MIRLIENWRDRRLKKWLIIHIARSPYPTANTNIDYLDMYFKWIKST